MKKHLKYMYISPKKSCGSDQIPSLTWSKLADGISQPLSYIFNLCLKEAHLPYLWKAADIAPLPKTTPPSIRDIRPISLLAMPERIFEKLLVKRIGDEFLSRFDYKQFAYRPKSSTTCALLEIEDRITSQLQERSVLACHLLAVDLMKGFDRVPHDLLIQKMTNDGFSKFTILFTRNYLHSRRMRVRWKGSFSSFSFIKSGIPQGSSLGPLIFGYFISDMNLCQSHNAMLVKYADDIFLLGNITKNTTKSPVIDAYEQVVKWTQKNKMAIRKEMSTNVCYNWRKK